MKWMVRHRATGETLKPIFEDRDAAAVHLIRMGPAFAPLYETIPDTSDPWTFHILTEGLVSGDLRRIVLPQISIDEYVPGDPNTDNIVIAFFIRGVPEAVIPFRDFIIKCKGILDVAYGDSDTIPDTSIVYAEMSREKFRFEDLETMMEQIGMLCQLEPEDFTVVFPTSSKRHPYDRVAIETYFTSRSAQKNWEEQQRALKQAKNQDDPDQQKDETGEPQE